VGSRSFAAARRWRVVFTYFVNFRKKCRDLRGDNDGGRDISISRITAVLDGGFQGKVDGLEVRISLM
jgi:hypothetical protein